MNHFFSNLFMFPGAPLTSGSRGNTPGLNDSQGVESKDPGKTSSNSPAARILRAGYICDIIRDQKTDPPIHHWLVQDCETNEIIGLGQAQSMSEAERHAVAFLDDLRQLRWA